MRSFDIFADIGLLVGFLVLAGSCAAFDGNSTCASLADSLQLENTTIISITHVSANTTVATAGSCQSTAQVSSDLCRVFAQVNTTSSSAVKFEMWLPDEWFGRFITVGNGGLGGCIDYSNLDYTSSFHFAAIGSDNGHDGDTCVFFLDHPEVINDLAFRAIHVSAERGKDIVQQYYNTTPAKSYYLGCSTGGRQGMKSALMFPDDFDGIMAGSPASDFNHLLGWSGLLSRAIGAPGTSSPSFIPDSLFPSVSAAILQQCDLLDGVKDGIITEPDDCFFDPSVLLCGTSTAGNDTNSCLTADQIEALNKIYSPVVSSEGVVLFPRLDPLAENQTSRELFFNGSMFQFTDGWWPNAIVNNTNFSFADFGVKDLVFADTINPGGIATFDGNFSEYRALGGKIVTYHGRFDGLIASGQSKRLRNLISSTLTPSNLDDFYRLFLVPGMEHCTGGPGAFNFGQDGTSLAVARNDSAHNGLLALVEWVEGDVAPGSIFGTAADGSVREHCRFPAFKSRFNGTDFECVEVA